MTTDDPQKPVCRCGCLIATRHGSTQTGKQRYECQRCKCTFVWPPSVRGNNWLPLAKVHIIEKLIRSGFSIREVSCLAGAAKHTVMRYASAIERPLCPCGKSVTHRGWCPERLKRHPKRQTTLAEMHKRRRLVSEVGEAVCLLVLRLSNSRSPAFIASVANITEQEVEAIIGQYPPAKREAKLKQIKGVSK